MDMGDVAAIMQIKTLRCVLRIEMCDVCIRKLWGLEMGAQIAGEGGQTPVWIDRTVDRGETYRVRVHVVRQEIKGLIRRLATVFCIKPPQKHLPLTIREAFEIRLTLGGISAFHLAC